MLILGKSGGNLKGRDGSGGGDTQGQGNWWLHRDAPLSARLGLWETVWPCSHMTSGKSTVISYQEILRHEPFAIGPFPNLSIMQEEWWHSNGSGVGFQLQGGTCAKTSTRLGKSTSSRRRQKARIDETKLVSTHENPWRQTLKEVLSISRQVGIWSSRFEY